MRCIFYTAGAASSPGLLLMARGCRAGMQKLKLRCHLK